MRKRKIFMTPISFLITLTLVFQVFGGMVLPGATVQAAGTDIYSTAANQTLDPDDPLDVVLTKPYRGQEVTKSGTTGTITIDLPYGTFYQMLHPVVNAGSTVKVYESDGAEIVRLAGINNGDYELGLKDSQGNRVVPGWTGGTYYLDVANGQNARRYTITVTIQSLSDFTLTRSVQGGETEAINKPGELVAPMNIRANEHGMDTWGSTYIGYGDTGLNSIEAPMKPSSYSGKDWYDSFWGPDVYVHTANDINKFKPAGVSNDLPKDDREIPLAWYGDNMYVQTIAKDNSDGRIDAYGVDVKYDGTMTKAGKISGFDKLQSDIIRIHKFDAPAAAPGHEDGDRGAASSTTQRLEMKTNYTPDNVVANDGPGTVTTHFWRLLVPSETVKRQKQVGANAIGTWSPNNYNYIYQIKESKGNANGSPTVGIGLRAGGTLSFEHSRNNSTPSGMQSAGGTNTGTFLTLSKEEFVDRWIDIELTTETADFGHLYVRVTDTDTGELLGEGTLNEADMLRRNTELQLPAPNPSGPGPVYREGNYNTLKDDQGNNVNFGRSKWGIYGSFPATGTGRQEWQSSTIYMADIAIIKRDRDTYVFPNGYKPTDRDLNLRIMGWEHQNQMKVSLGTKVTDLTLKDELDVTLSNGHTVKVPVKWDTSGYRPTVPGTYRILGELQPSEASGITIPAAPDNYYPDYYKPYFEINNSTVHDWGKAVMGADIKIVSHNEEAPKGNVLEEDRTSMTTSEGYAFFQSGSSFEMNAGRTPWRYWVALDLGRQIDISRIEIEFGTMGSPGRSRNSSAWWTNDAEAFESLIESYNNFYNPLDPALAAGQPEPDRPYYEANNWPTKNPFGVENLVGYSGPWNYFAGSGRQPANANSQSTSAASNWNPLTQEALKGGTLGTNYTLGRRATDVLANNDGKPITARYVMVVNELNFFSSVTGPPGTVSGSSPGPMQFLDFAVIGELHDDLADLMVLETLTVDGVPIAEFDPGTKNYTLDVAAYHPLPTVAATLSSDSIDAGAKIDIIQATADEKTAVVRISRTDGKDVYYLVNLNEVDIPVDQAIDAAKTAVESAAYTAEQAEIGVIAQAKTAVETIIGSLNLYGVTATVADDTFTAAVAGTESDERGTDGSYTFTVTLSKEGGTPQTTVTLTLAITATPYATSVTSVTVSPSTATVQKGSTKAFTASVIGTNNPAQTVAWTIEGNVALNAGTTISSDGIVTVSAAETASTITITATSTVDITKSGTATVAVIDAPTPDPGTNNGGPPSGTGPTPTPTPTPSPVPTITPAPNTTPTVSRTSTQRQKQIAQDAPKADAAIAVAGPASTIKLRSTDVMQPVSLTISPAVAAKVATYAYMESDGTIVPIPTLIDRATGAVTLLVSSNGDYFPVAVNKKFNDVESSAWYAESVEQAANRLIVSGYNSLFRPIDSVTVAESMAMFMRTLGLAVNPDAITTTNEWFGKTMATAESKGLTEGITESLPSSNIARKSAVQIAAAALKLAGVNTTLSKAEVNEWLAPFTDVAALSVSERNALAIGVKYKIFAGYGDGTIRPDAELTRAQMAIVAINIQKRLLDLKIQKT
jgi:hypothetical protein